MKNQAVRAALVASAHAVIVVMAVTFVAQATPWIFESWFGVVYRFPKESVLFLDFQRIVASNGLFISLGAFILAYCEFRLALKPSFHRLSAIFDAITVLMLIALFGLIMWSVHAASYPFIRDWVVVKWPAPDNSSKELNTK